MSRKLLAGTLLVAATGLALVFGTESRGPIYAYSVERFLAEPVRDTTVRIAGKLVHGSLCRRESECGYRFRLEERFQPELPSDTPRPSLAVTFPHCIVPDTFRDVAGVDLELAVEGKLCGSCHTFEASSIMAKCPGKYEMRPDGGVGPCGAGRAPAPLPLCPSP